MNWLLALVVIAVGALIPLQAGINASLRYTLNSAVLAAIVNFSVGGVLLIACALATRVELPAWETVARAPWWYWIGGSMGALLVLAGVLSHRLGAAAFVACIILGQLTSSVVLDHFGLAGYQAHAVNPMRLLGLGLLALGVYVIRTH